MLHFTNVENISGPNTSAKRIENSWLKDHYQFGRLIQSNIPGRVLNMRLLYDMARQVRLFKPDIVHVSGLQSAGFYAVLAARIGGCKNVVTTVRGSSSEAIGFNPLFKRLYQHVIEPLTMSLSSNVYTVCNHLSEKFKINKRKNYSGVIHNPAPIIDIEKLDRLVFRKEMEIDRDQIVVTIVGRMVYDKGISFIIDAIKNIPQQNIVFIFVGDGPYCEQAKEQLNQEIKEQKVFVLGKRDDVLNILAGSDIFLFATLHENLSNALLEACKVGLLVIATDVGGNKEVIEHEVNGLLIPPKSSQAIVDAIDTFYSCPDKMKACAKAVKKDVEDNFSQEKIFQKVRNIYESILKRD